MGVRLEVQANARIVAAPLLPSQPLQYALERQSALVTAALRARTGISGHVLRAFQQFATGNALHISCHCGMNRLEESAQIQLHNT